MINVGDVVLSQSMSLKIIDFFNYLIYIGLTHYSHKVFGGFIMSVRKHITLSENDYQIIYDFALKNGFTFSELLRQSALNFIKRSESIDLLDYINANLSAISQEEREELDSLDIDFDDLNGVELNIT